jgi:hypothetical protein
VRVNLAATRGLFAGWIVAATVPLLFRADTIAAWATLGLGHRSRWALCCIEIVGALLFPFERSVIPGAVLLVSTFLAAAALHVRHGLWPWWLAGYAVIVVALAWPTQKLSARRSAHAAGRTPRADAG